MCIINSSRGFIFVHVPKAGGTSVTSFLSRFTSYTDLEIGGTPFGERVQQAYIDRFGIGKHSSAIEIKALVGDVAWRRSFTFSFVRNPFTRCASMFSFLQKYEGYRGPLRERIKSFASFEEFVLSRVFEKNDGPDRIFRPQVYWLRANVNSDDLLVDFVGRLESMQSDMARILDCINVPKVYAEAEIPHVNVSARGDICAGITNEMADIIVERYRADFRLFGYSTDPAHAYTAAEPAPVVETAIVSGEAGSPDDT